MSLPEGFIDLTGSDPNVDLTQLQQMQAGVNIISKPLADSRNAHKEFLCVQKLDKDAVIPLKGTEGSIGYDLFAFGSHELPPWSRKLIGTKIAIRVPNETYGRIAPRSGLALKGIDIAGGVIDIDYRGEIGIILVNNTNEYFNVNHKDKIAQLIIERAAAVPVKELRSLDRIFGATARGSGGFGHTG